MTFVSFAQNYEDVILWRALKNVENGCYIDVGAHDPIVDSVTKAFYDRGWRGLNIEPVGSWYNKIVLDRPDDINLRIAVGEKKGNLPFYEVVDTGLSTMDEGIAKRHAETRGFDILQYDVPVVPLTDIINDYVPGDIHFLKIDVEGSEQNVLLGLDFSMARPWIIIVESTLPLTQLESYQGWESLLIENQYHFVYFDGLNRFYVADEKSELDGHFDRPPNYFDHFERVAKTRADQRIGELVGELGGITSQFQDLQSQHHTLLVSKEEGREELLKVVHQLTEANQLLDSNTNQVIQKIQANKEREVSKLISNHNFQIEKINTTYANQLALEKKHVQEFGKQLKEVQTQNQKQVQNLIITIKELKTEHNISLQQHLGEITAQKEKEIQSLEGSLQSQLIKIDVSERKRVASDQKRVMGMARQLKSLERRSDETIQELTRTINRFKAQTGKYKSRIEHNELLLEEYDVSGKAMLAEHVYMQREHQVLLQQQAANVSIIARLQGLLTSASEQQQQFETSLSEAQVQIRAQQARHTAVINSTSWKITSPIRVFSNLFRKVVWWLSCGLHVIKQGAKRFVVKSLELSLSVVRRSPKLKHVLLLVLTPSPKLRKKLIKFSRARSTMIIVDIRNDLVEAMFIKTLLNSKLAPKNQALLHRSLEIFERIKILSGNGRPTTKVADIFSTPNNVQLLPSSTLNILVALRNKVIANNIRNEL